MAVLSALFAAIPLVFIYFFAEAGLMVFTSEQTVLNLRALELKSHFFFRVYSLTDSLTLSLVFVFAKLAHWRWCSLVRELCISIQHTAETQ